MKRARARRSSVHDARFRPLSPPLPAPGRSGSGGAGAARRDAGDAGHARHPTPRAQSGVAGLSSRCRDRARLPVRIAEPSERFTYRCHILEHEDMEMMREFQVE
ncbi:multicopper oxidase domain-containing protein [Methylosinus trichosporium]|uniref:multicopper oxidase domain-containing protein n=1 Tax=Methylosinus TaxID=425 RepID=UPI0012FFF271